MYYVLIRPIKYVIMGYALNIRLEYLCNRG